MTIRRRAAIAEGKPRELVAAGGEEMIVLPCCAHKIGVDVDTPVGAELRCVFCGSRLILRGRPGSQCRHFDIKDP